MQPPVVKITKSHEIFSDFNGFSGAGKKLTKLLFSLWLGPLLKRDGLWVIFFLYKGLSKTYHRTDKSN